MKLLIMISLSIFTLLIIGCKDDEMNQPDETIIEFLDGGFDIIIDTTLYEYQNEILGQ